MPITGGHGLTSWNSSIIQNKKILYISSFSFRVNHGNISFLEMFLLFFFFEMALQISLMLSSKIIVYIMSQKSHKNVRFSWMDSAYTSTVYVFDRECNLDETFQDVGPSLDWVCWRLIVVEFFYDLPKSILSESRFFISRISVRPEFKDFKTII